MEKYGNYRKFGLKDAKFKQQEITRRNEAWENSNDACHIVTMIDTVENISVASS